MCGNVNRAAKSLRPRPLSPLLSFLRLPDEDEDVFFFLSCKIQSLFMRYVWWPDFLFHDGSFASAAVLIKEISRKCVSCFGKNANMFCVCL